MPGKRCFWLGLDVGATKIVACVVDSDYRCIARCKLRTRDDKGGGDPLDRMEKAASEALEEAGISRKNLSGIGVGLCGMLDLDRGILLEAPNLGWKKIRVAETLRRRFGVPTVIANDVDAGTYGEYRLGSAQKGRCVLGVFPGTGIGGACVYMGRLIRGRVGSAMEIGHMPVEPDGLPCGCGKRGCLETVASRLAIAGQAAQAAYRGEAPCLLKLGGTDVAKIRSGMLAESVRGGDRIIEEIIRGAANWLGYAIAGVVHLLAPDVVLLGGGLVEEFPDLYLKETVEAVKERGLEVFVRGIRFCVAELGGDAVALGAAALAAEGT